MCLQIVGKVRHTLSPKEPDWGHAPLYLTARGLNTSPIPHANGVFDIDVDLIDHVVSVRTTAGQVDRIPLESRPVADFYAELMGVLDAAGLPVEIDTKPSDVPDGIPFAEDVVHATYDPEWANRFWNVLVLVDRVLKEDRAGFAGKVSPVQLWWGSFDLAYSRFAGAADRPPRASGRATRGLRRRPSTRTPRRSRMGSRAPRRRRPALRGARTSASSCSRTTPCGPRSTPAARCSSSSSPPAVPAAVRTACE